MFVHAPCGCSAHLPAQNVDQANYAIHVEGEQEVFVRFVGAESGLSAAATRIVGRIDGEVSDSDLRGADMRELEGKIRFVRCLLFRALLPPTAELVECETDSLFPDHSRSKTGGHRDG